MTVTNYASTEGMRRAKRLKTSNGITLDPFVDGMNNIWPLIMMLVCDTIPNAKRVRVVCKKFRDMVDSSLRLFKIVLTRDVDNPGSFNYVWYHNHTLERTNYVIYYEITKKSLKDRPFEFISRSAKPILGGWSTPCRFTILESRIRSTDPVVRRSISMTTDEMNYDLANCMYTSFEVLSERPRHSLTTASGKVLTPTRISRNVHRISILDKEIEWTFVVFRGSSSISMSGKGLIDVIRVSIE